MHGTEEPEDWNPSIDELIDAVEDESHPRHEEAIELNRESAKRMKPLLDSLKASTAPIASGLSEAFKVVVPKIDIPEVSQIVNQIDPVEDAVKPIQFRSRTIDSWNFNAQEHIDAVIEARDAQIEEKKAREEREIQTLELLQAMVSQITESNTKISELSAGLDTINESLVNSDNKAADAHKGEMRLGWATFLGTISSVFATVIVFLLGR